ncbi:MAG: DNA-formamidopyrimidine glycosylase family protein [Ginsengibacter sp.]
MPELPDLQVFSRNLNKMLAGKTLQKVSVPVDKKLNVSTEELRSSIEKQKLDEVYREGKELHFKFSNGNVLALQFNAERSIIYF